MTYLERYKNGEYEQVWTELLALGSKIREEPLYADALAVATETMTRSRHNIELLVKRLEELDYQFLEPDNVFIPPKPNVSGKIEELEQLAGVLPVSLRMCYELIGAVNLIGRHPKLSSYKQENSIEEKAEIFLSLYSKYYGTSPAWDGTGIHLVKLRTQLLEQAHKGISSEDELDKRLQTFNNFVMEYDNATNLSDSSGLDIFSDPLVIMSIDSAFEDYQLWERVIGEENWNGMWINLFPSGNDKANEGDYNYYAQTVPNLAVDAPLLLQTEFAAGNRTEYKGFVEYLRESFQWGGFPGLKHSNHPPFEELAFLTKDLLPI